MSVQSEFAKIVSQHATELTRRRMVETEARVLAMLSESNAGCRVIADPPSEFGRGLYAKHEGMSRWRKRCYCERLERRAAHR